MLPSPQLFPPLRKQFYSPSHDNIALLATSHKTVRNLFYFELKPHTNINLPSDFSILNEFFPVLVTCIQKSKYPFFFLTPNLSNYYTKTVIIFSLNNTVRTWLEVENKKCQGWRNQGNGNLRKCSFHSSNLRGREKGSLAILLLFIFYVAFF